MSAFSDGKTAVFEKLGLLPHAKREENEFRFHSFATFKDDGISVFGSFKGFNRCFQTQVDSFTRK